jgi:dolichol-phosphate mannosyltransferase
MDRVSSGASRAGDVVDALGSLTVVMPAYDEAALIEDAVEEVVRSVLSAVPGSRLLVVDDGSRDATGAILDRLSARDARVVVIQKPNGGHGSALLRGLQEPLAAWTLLIDSDRQIPLDGFLMAWQARTNNQAVLGIRMGRQDPPARKIVTTVLQWALVVLLGVSLTDPNIPFKLVRKDALEEVLQLMPSNALIPSVFIAAYIARHRLPVAFVPLFYRQRPAGQGSLRHWKLLKLSAQATLQLVAFSLLLRRQHRSPVATEPVERRAS